MRSTLHERWEGVAEGDVGALEERCVADEVVADAVHGGGQSGESESHSLRSGVLEGAVAVES